MHLLQLLSINLAYERQVDFEDIGEMGSTN